MTLATLDGVLPLDRGRPEPLHAQLKTILKRQILDGAIKAGDRLPTEMEIGEHYAVSRVTVRRTLGELASEGFVERQAGIGTTVRPHVFWDRRSHRLYGFYEEMRAQGLDAHAEITSVTHGLSTRAESEALGIHPGARVTRVRQVGYVDGEPISVADVTLILPRGAHLSAHELIGEPTVYPYLERTLGLMFHDADKSLAAEAAGSDDAELLGVAVGAPVLVAEVVATLADPAAAMLIRTRYRGDRYRYTIALHD